MENFDGERNGSISLEEALWLSDNSVFTDLVMNAGGQGLENGPTAVVNVAKRLGVQADFGEKLHPSLVLGTGEVSPLDMATAYATIANEGRRVEPHTIVRVVKNEGEKGYTPQLLTAVWMGYAEGGATMAGLLNLGGDYVGPVEPPTVIWRDYTSRALAGEPAEEFEGVDTSRYDPPPPRLTRQPGAGGSTVPQPTIAPDATASPPSSSGAGLSPNAASPAPPQTWAQPRR